MVTDANAQLLSAFDGHDVDGVREALKAGATANEPIRGKLPVYWLLEEYHRTDRLGPCLPLLFDHGAVMDNNALRAVLLNDAARLRTLAGTDPNVLTHRVSLRSAFTSLSDVTLLHVAAEYGNFEAARALVELGADVNAAAGVTNERLNGHTPIFHTVNSNANRSAPIMDLLLGAGARCDVRLDGIEWGKGYEWETIFFDVTPISYAQFGLMPQVHRREAEIYANIKKMLSASGRAISLENIPNKYLRK